jgi:hypothetical protein
MKIGKWMILLSIICTALTGCQSASGGLAGQPSPSAPPAARSAKTPTLPAAAAASATPADQALFTWESQSAACETLRFTTPNQAWTGACGGTLSAHPYNRPEFTEMLARFAPFHYEADGQKLVFEGRGLVEGAAWQRALLAFARLTYGELSSGRACAACATVFSWQAGRVPGQSATCRQVLILSYGYAYADVYPCAGGALISHSAGWLETPEWEQMDSWLANFGETRQDENYLLGTGEKTMSGAERSRVDAWAVEVFLRLTGN